MQYDMIAMDLDGTTLQEDHETFSPRLIEALRKAHEKGVLVVPSTGRPIGAMPPALQNNPVWESYAILANGEEIRNLKTGEVLQELLVKPEIAHLLLDYAEKHNVCIELYQDGKIYLTEKSHQREKAREELEFHMSEVIEKDGVFLSDLRSVIREDRGLERIQLLCMTEEQKEEVFQMLEPKHLSVLTSWMGEDHMEVTHYDAHKGKAVETLCSMLNIDMKRVIALGDQDNDKSMIRMCGLGVAMGNGPDHVKEVADIVAKANTEDGAAEIIEKYILGE